eukprot:gene1542-1941_t
MSFITNDRWFHYFTFKTELSYTPGGAPVYSYISASDTKGLETYSSTSISIGDLYVCPNCPNGGRCENNKCKCVEPFIGGNFCDYTSPCIQRPCGERGACPPPIPCKHGVCTPKGNTTEFDCKCPSGFKFGGFECIDIDECYNDPYICGGTETDYSRANCINTEGSYKCQCPNEAFEYEN